MKSMLERDGKIEEALVKGQEMKVTTVTFKKRATSVNQNMKWRNRWYAITICLVVTLLLTILIWWLIDTFSTNN